MIGPVAPLKRRPPGVYRLARAFRRASVVALVLILVFVVTVAISAVQVARSKPSAGGFSAQFAANDTVAVTGGLNLTNPGFYPIQSFTLHVRVLNASHVLLGASTAGPVTFAPGGSQVFPVAFYLPISENGPAASLLTVDQTLNVTVWANATYAYTLPLSVSVETNKSWGAPFANLQVSVGTPTGGGGGVSVPVTVQFDNHASFPEIGTLAFSLLSPGGTDCGSGALALDVPAGQPFSQTTNVAVNSGCSVAGGTLTTTYTGNGAMIPLPSERIP